MFHQRRTTLMFHQDSWNFQPLFLASTILLLSLRWEPILLATCEWTWKIGFGVEVGLPVRFYRQFAFSIFQKLRTYILISFASVDEMFDKIQQALIFRFSRVSEMSNLIFALRNPICCSSSSQQPFDLFLRYFTPTFFIQKIRQSNKCSTKMSEKHPNSKSSGSY